MKVLNLLLCAVCSLQLNAQSLVLDVQFNGTTTDSKGHTVNVYGSPTYTTAIDGTVNGALRFNGTSDYLTIPHAADLELTNGFTMVAMVRPQGFYTGTCHGNFIISKGPSGDPGFIGLSFSDDLYIRNLNVANSACNQPLYTSKQTFFGSRNQTSTTYSAPEQNTPPHVSGQAASTALYNTYTTNAAPITLNTWYCVKYTYDATINTSNLYVNGALVATNTSAPVFNSYTTEPLVIGRHINNNFPTYTYYFTGDMDEIQIYNTALPKNGETTLPQCAAPLAVNNITNQQQATIQAINNNWVLLGTIPTNSIVQVYTATGSLVQQFGVVNNTMPISVPAGMYVTRLITPQYTTIAKHIVQ